MLLPAFIISFCFNLLEGALSFIIVEINGFKNSFRHIFRLMSGAWVPLYFFPDGIRQIAEALPFVPAVFGPVNALKVNSFTEVSQMFVTGVIWSAVLILFSFVIWKSCLKRYDGVGI